VELDANQQDAPLRGDLLDSVLKNVGKAAVAQWTAALREKQALPRLAPAKAARLSAKELERLHRSNGGIFLPRHPQSVVVSRADNLLPKASFGFTGVFAKVVAKSQFIDGILVLRTEHKQVEHLVSESLRMFRWDERQRRFKLVPHSMVDPQGGYVSARIAHPGVYAIIGLHLDPAVLETVKIVCQLKELSQRVPIAAREALKKRTCELILCAGDRGAAVGGDGSNLCEQCIEIPTDVFFDLPECQILTEPRCTDSDWECVGPFEIIGEEDSVFNRGIGCCKQLAIDPSNHHRVYATGENGGLWVLERADRWPESTWRPMTDQLEGLQMRAVAVAPSNTRHLYVGNGLGFVYRSSNRGVSWSRTSPTNFGFIRRILVHASTPETLFVAANSGFYLSSDGGASWNQLLDPAAFASVDTLDAIMDPDDSSILYIGVRGQGVFKTFDSGQHWRLVLPFAVAAQPSRQMIRLALGHRKADGSPQTDRNRTLAVKFGREVFTSLDGGRTQPASRGRRGDDGGVASRSDSGTSTGEWCNVLAIDPHNPDIILAGQEDLYKTTDGGATWRRIVGNDNAAAPDGLGNPGRLIHEDFQDIRFDQDVPGLAYIACDGGVYIYKDGRVSDPSGGDVNTEAFEERNLNFATSQFFRVAVQGDLAVGNLDHNGLKGTTDVASGVWRKANKFGGNNALEFSFVYADPKRANRFYVFYVSKDENHLRRLRFPSLVREDFIQYAPFVPFTAGRSRSLPVGPVAVDMRAGSDTLLVCANKSDREGFRLMMTTEADVEPTLDAARVAVGLPSWNTAIDNGRIHPLVSVTFAPSSPGTAYVISANGVVSTKPDVNVGAVDADWEVRGQWLQSDVRQLVVHSQFEEKLYAISGTSFGRSTNGGRTWPSAGITSPPGTELNSIVVHPHDPFTLFIGADSGVFVSRNDGENWSPFDDRLPNAEVTQVFIERGRLYAVTHGRGLWRRKIC
jgi:photosystem II stability/assembly factor-like uncharacterized protein